LENEWIEIFNQNDFEVDISSWKIKDKIGRTTSYIFSANTKISPLGYLVLKRPETKITLNNSGEGLEFINPNDKIIDSVDFGKALVGQSYNKIEENWFWSETLTPEKANILPEKEPSFVKTSEDKKKSENGSLSAVFLGEETAAIGEKLIKSSSFLSTLLTAFAIAIFSATAILFLKKKTSPKISF